MTGQETIREGISMNAMNATSQQNGTACEAKPARFVINAQVEGFPVSIEVEGKAEALKAMIDRLKAIGATPPQANPAAPARESGPPVCPVHQTPMKASRKPGSYFCSKRNEFGDYCTEKG